MTAYTKRLPHVHPGLDNSGKGALYMLIKQSNFITAHGVSWTGALPKLTGRESEPEDNTTAERFIWALSLSAFQQSSLRHFEQEAQPDLSLATWISTYDTSSYDLLVGQRHTDSDTWTMCTSDDSEGPCPGDEAAGPAAEGPPETTCSLKQFIEDETSSGTMQADYGVSPIFVGDQQAGFSLLLRPLSENGNTSYEIWRLDPSINSVSLNYSMSTAAGIWGKQDATEFSNYRQHINGLLAELSVHTDMKQSFGLSIYDITLHKPG